MKVKSLLVEDNPFMATLLSDLLMENHPNIEVMDIAKNGEEGIEKINNLQPELVFLDIEMPDMNGFEMLSKLDSIKFQTIFITAHSHYAIKAFRFNALDYLVKPVEAAQLKQSIGRFKHPTEENQNSVKNALDNLKKEKIEEQKLVLPTQQKLLQIPLMQIYFIESDRNYSYIYLTDGSRELSSKTLSYFEDILKEKGFYRCHRSFLINQYHIVSIGKESFRMTDQKEVPISRRKKTEAKIWHSHL
jgi:two-component system LytT family response regulator